MKRSYFGRNMVARWSHVLFLCPRVKRNTCSSCFPRSILTLLLFSCIISGHSNKRFRTENHQVAQQQQIDLQNEVNSLKSEKNGLESSLATLRTEHEKVVNENKTLKRAVIIQQERQNQAVSEINAGRQYKAEAEEKIKKLEQLVLSLRYHLQAQQHNPPANDWMGFRPPDVY